MPLFQKTVLTKYSNTLDQSKIDKQWSKFKAHFQNPIIQQNIRDSKEEQYQEGFINDLFVNVLGYIKNPTPDFNITTELKNEGNSKKTDAAVILEGTVSAVIELKGCNTTDLSKVEAQAFGYKNRQANCQYVVTSNFEKIRFYIDNAIEHIEFNLFELSREEFNTLWLCLSYESILKGIPAIIKDESVSTEDQITKQLYKDYSQFKRDLFNDLVSKNPQFDQLQLFKKTQKLLDRFLFIFFAEDRLLLPTNLIVSINKEWKELQEMRVSQSLYDRYKLYFEDLNIGNSKQDIFAYNGGLFQPDELLDHLKVDDDLLFSHTNKISSYDFESEVDVNILGHIFENSLNEIEEITAKLEGTQLETNKTKRKKDGVFYTPKYITKYIVENTIGTLCENKKTELEITDELYTNAKKRSRKRLENLQEYRDWLLQLTICDPACGSGAFLNQALEFLIAEHQYLDELSAKYNNDPLVLSDVENSILENNLYGVDINEESVHIAKLSLWLRTAQRNRKLNSLNQNIKCGNSLIDDPEIAGKKAFKWEQEFPEIFNHSSGSGGGFDVVIGNPPYLRIQGLIDAYPELVSYYEKHFYSATGNYDIYVLFTERSTELINANGLVSFILPHKFLISEFGEGIRKFISDNKLMKSILHFEENLVFEVTTYTCILTLNKDDKSNLLFKYINPREILEPFEWDEIKYKRLGSENWNLMSEQKIALFDKLKTQPLTAKKVFSKIFQGIATSADKIYLINGKTEGDFIKGYSSSLEELVALEKGLMKPMLKGQDVSRYKALENQYYIIFPYFISEDGSAKEMSETYIQKTFPKGYEYLKRNEQELRARERGRFDNAKEWFLFSRKQGISEVEQQKIITPEIANYPNMTFDDGVMYHNTKCYSFILKKPNLNSYKFYLAVLNSRLLWFYLSNTGYVLRGGYFTFKTKYLFPFPLPEIPENQEIFTNKADKMLSLNADLNQLSDKFLRTLNRKFEIEKLSKKLENWHKLNFDEFVIELGKKKVKLSLAQEAEWEDYFLAEKEKAEYLKNQIKNTDEAINQLVYELYGLDKEEIKIVENSINA